jgi:hypothetical protein
VPHATGWTPNCRKNAKVEFVARRRAVIAANPELREREALKGLGLTASMIGALKRRCVPDLTSSVAAGLSALAWKIAYERWSDTGRPPRRPAPAVPAGNQALRPTAPRRGPAGRHDNAGRPPGPTRAVRWRSSAGGAPLSLGQKSRGCLGEEPLLGFR